VVCWKWVTSYTVNFGSNGGLMEVFMQFRYCIGWIKEKCTDGGDASFVDEYTWYFSTEFRFYSFLLVQGKSDLFQISEACLMGEEFIISFVIYLLLYNFVKPLVIWCFLLSLSFWKCWKYIYTWVVWKLYGIYEHLIFLSIESF